MADSKITVRIQALLKYSKSKWALKVSPSIWTWTKEPSLCQPAVAQNLNRRENLLSGPRGPLLLPVRPSVVASSSSLYLFPSPPSPSLDTPVTPVTPCSITVTPCYIHVTPLPGYRMQIYVCLFFSVFLFLHKVMDYTVHKLGRYVKHTCLFFQFQPCRLF